MMYIMEYYFEICLVKFFGDVEDILIFVKFDFEYNMKKFKLEVEDLLGLVFFEKDVEFIFEKEFLFVKFNMIMKKQFLEWLEFKKELDEM